MKSKRFFVAIVAVVCVSVVTVLLKYPAETYLKIILGIVLGYKTAQTVTDMKK